MRSRPDVGTPRSFNAFVIASPKGRRCCKTIMISLGWTPELFIEIPSPGRRGNRAVGSSMRRLISLATAVANRVIGEATACG